jgi:hypothetical protein
MLFGLIDFSVFVHLQSGQNLFTPAPFGAIGMKIGEFRKVGNIYFKEFRRYNILKHRRLC